MKQFILITFMLVALLGCINQRPSKPLQSPTPTPVTPTKPTDSGPVWAVYNPDPDHPWNRVFRQLYRRTARDGKEYGADELDPLLWYDTTYLLIGPSHQEAIQVLDEFLSSHAENLIRDPLKRAMFQRDLWAVFDWLTSQAEPFPAQRQTLETRLAQIIKRVALTKEEIASLPDNYGLAVKSRDFPTSFQKDQPQMAFLPPDLFRAESAWVPMGRKGGPVAMTHVSSDPFLGRSVFLVFFRSPQGREATLNFIESLNTQPKPILVSGSEVALVRRMLLIDQQGELILSPLIESIQIRHFNPRQSFYEFELNRTRLFDGQAGGLVQNTDLFMLFMSHGDVFENPDIPDLQAKIPDICKGCHFEDDSPLDSANRKSIISYSRDRFPLPENQHPILVATTWAEEAQTVIEWKHRHATWQTLEAVWDQSQP